MSRELLPVVVLTLVVVSIAVAVDIEPQKGKQAWGYTEVRPGANMFWWLYYTTGSGNHTDHPVILWLQGGPGASSTGMGNFGEIGPQNMHLKNRTETWITYANVLFLDNPVGSGFSYVNDTNLLAKNSSMVISDLMMILKWFFQKLPEFQSVPFYIFGESYGGKMAVQLAVALEKQISKGKIKCSLKGVALGDSWISPVDSVMTWGPYLFSTSFVDSEGLAAINKSAYAVKEAVDKKEFAKATKLWAEAEDEVLKATHGVDFYNILTPRESQSVGVKQHYLDKLYDHHVQKGSSDVLSDLMNGPVKDMLRIIPKNVTWGGQSKDVFKMLSDDFMMSVTDDVEMLLNNTTVEISVYSGQLDLVVDTLGTIKWVEDLKWPGIPLWNRASREAIQTNNHTVAFRKSSKNFSFYWILRAGHMVPADVPKASVALLKNICHL